MSEAPPVPDPLPARAAVCACLEEIRRGHGVAIPLAIESGSRAWGFPSPDSDYDCRFIFVRPLEDYLTLFAPRDVIETPISGDLDVNGWDLGKALKLILKGNAVAIEWLTSPLVYRLEPAFREALLDFADRFADAGAIRSHYLHLGTQQRDDLVRDGTSASLKKVFYALRPAAALRWLRLHPGAKLPPMHFPTLVGEGGWPGEMEDLTRELMRLKAATREMGRGAMPDALRAFIDAEFARAREDAAPPRIAPEARAEADRLFRSLIERHEGDRPA